MTEDSPITEGVRRRAMRISERFGHAPREYVDYLKRIQEQLVMGLRLTHRGRKRVAVARRTAILAVNGVAWASCP